MAAQSWEVGGVVREVDYYELLGIGRDAGAAEIKSAYRTLARSMHPDVGGTPGTFRLLQQAYETLSDPARRAEYDRPVPDPPARPAARKRPRGFGDDPHFEPRLPKLGPHDVPWWYGVDPDARIRYLPQTGPDRAPALAMLGGWSLLLVSGLAVPLPPLLLMVWLGVLVGSGAVLVLLLRKHLRARRTDREFTAEFGGRKVFGLPDGQDERARLLTAELCAKYLTRLPGVRIFHGLAWPDSVFEDVDHAVLCGRRLVLVESKSWLPGHYAADEGGELWRNGHVFRGGSTRLDRSVAAFEELLPGVEVCGAVLIYPSRAGEVTTVDQPEVPVAPMTPAQFVRDIGRWLAEDPVGVDRDAFVTVLDQVVSA
ncbi:J domain-containing protein [Saccharopolyspora cebuensis]|uniref:DnaJ domain-containing protein n=1 Tax=Saccharopolyspora cebuensis TaxID=418759 RepID=A0ABV4CJF7_9PSEU